MIAQRQDKRRGAEDEIKKVLKNKRCQKITTKQSGSKSNFKDIQEDPKILECPKRMTFVRSTIFDMSCCRLLMKRRKTNKIS